MVCKGRGRRATSVCANCRLWSDEGVAEAFRRNNAIIVLHKLQLFLFNGASRANCRGRRPRRPALAEGNMSPMRRFLLVDSNLCRGELRSSVWFAHNHGCGSMWASAPYKCGTPQICAKLRADMESAPTIHRKL